MHFHRDFLSTRDPVQLNLKTLEKIGKTSNLRSAYFLAIFHPLAVVNVLKNWSREEAELSSKLSSKVVPSLTALLSCPLLLLSFKNVPISLQSSCIPGKWALGQASEDLLENGSFGKLPKAMQQLHSGCPGLELSNFLVRIILYLSLVVLRL